MFTSRAEHRLFLREDNADFRLTKIGWELGIISTENYSNFKKKQVAISSLLKKTKKVKINPTPKIQRELDKIGENRLKKDVKIFDLLKRPNLNFVKLSKCNFFKEKIDLRNFSKEVLDQVQILIKYEGYLIRQNQELKHIKKLDRINLPDNLEFSQIPGLSTEVVENLEKARPTNLGEASRISGITPAAVSILRIHLHTKQAA
tara:strand:- start:98 stop:706 length:609 start_codon:yes stop_codon:yes gene_type:complete